MEITGKVTHVLEPITGTSDKGDWKKQTFVILENKDQYPKSIAFDAFNKDFNLKAGDEVVVSINIESREYKGKWYTNVNAWKVDVKNQQSAPTDNLTAGQVNAGTEELPTDDLPF